MNDVCWFSVNFLLRRSHMYMVHFGVKAGLFDGPANEPNRPAVRDRQTGGPSDWSRPKRVSFFVSLHWRASAAACVFMKVTEQLKEEERNGERKRVSDTCDSVRTPLTHIQYTHNIYRAGVISNKVQPKEDADFLPPKVQCSSINNHSSFSKAVIIRSS